MAHKRSTAHIAMMALVAVSFIMEGMAQEISTANSATPPKILTTAASVRGLDVGEANLGLPVRIEGTALIDALQDGSSAFYLADETTAIYLDSKDGISASIRRGQRLRIEGKTIGGQFAPYIRVERVTQLGTATIQAPLPMTLADIAHGRYISQWIKVKGIVRSVEALPYGPASWRFEIVSGTIRQSVVMRRPAATPPEIDAVVEVSAICAGRFDSSRQWLGAFLIVPGDVPINVLKPAPTEPPLRPINRLMAFSMDDSNLHRVKVRGVVTHYEPDNGFWIQELGRGLHIKSNISIPLIQGEVVEVIGFADFGAYSPVLKDVTVTRLAYGAPPEALKLNKASLALKNDEELVSLEGVITNQKPTPKGVLLTLWRNDGQFDVMLDHLGGVDVKSAWPIGARILATGISVVTEVGVSNENQNTNSPSFELIEQTERLGKSLNYGLLQPLVFSLLARSPSDLKVIAPPPWWTPARLVWAMGIACVALLLGIGTVSAFARDRLRKSASARRQSEMEFAGIWNERNRIAREIHDTLAQSLGAITLHLELVKDHLAPGSNAATHLNEARNLTRGSMEETRNSIWKMRSHALETGDLASALTNVLNRLTANEDIEGRFTLKGSSCRLPPVMENNLLRIGQEAIINAVKHAKARNIEVSLNFTSKELRLQVSDDGCGFNYEGAPPRDDSFGLIGMRERAREIHAEFTILPLPKQGTRVVVVFQLSAARSLERVGEDVMPNNKS